MNLKEEKAKLETLQYFRSEIQDRSKIIEFFNKSMDSNSGFFRTLLEKFKINYQTTQVKCSNGMFTNIEMDEELKKDIIKAFEKSQLRLENLYKSSANEFMSTVDLKS